jgi:hypothetical protein
VLGDICVQLWMEWFVSRWTDGRRHMNSISASWSANGVRGESELREMNDTEAVSKNRDR